MHWKSLDHIIQPVILGSGSPRRQDLFKYIFNKFEIITTDAELEQDSGDAADFVLRNARYKAERILSDNKVSLSHGTLFTFDTVVALENRILGKPVNCQKAREMLQDLCGKSHQVLTAYCVIRLDDSEELLRDYASTNVKFINYDTTHLDAYLAMGESLDKAGSYGIQGFGRLLVDSIEGCYFNVVGMPITAVFQGLKGLNK
tara:strand:- start:2575 stop:3180 length:606 start_codon:yes stop_codon:yes gene_type:complete